MKRPLGFLTLLTCLSFPLAGCKEPLSDPTPPRMPQGPTVPSPSGSNSYANASEVSIAGCLSVGFEIQALTPRGEQNAYWLSNSSDPALVLRIKALLGPHPFGFDARHRQLFLIGRGRLSKPGHYGHLGAYEYEITVDHVFELRLPTLSDCQ